MQALCLNSNNLVLCVGDNITAGDLDSGEWTDSRVSSAACTLRTIASVPVGYAPECWTYNGTTWAIASGSETIVADLIADVANDYRLTPDEKQPIRAQWDVAAAEKAGIDSQFFNDAATTEKTTYDNAFQALATYLNNGTTWSSGVPSWLADANLLTTTSVIGADFRAAWRTYYDSRTALFNTINASAKTAIVAAVSAGGKVYTQPTDPYPLHPTFTRATVATKLDGTQVAAGVPRMEIGKFGQAIMIEETTVNLLTNPSFESGLWLEEYNPSAGVPELVGGWNGSGSAMRITLTGAAASYGMVSARNITLAENDVISISFRCRSNKVTTISYLYLMSTLSGNKGFAVKNVTTEWTRITFSYTVPTGEGSADYGLMLSAASTDWTTNDWFEFDDVQLEVKSAATSFVTGTRNSEKLSIPTANILSVAEGTIECLVFPTSEPTAHGTIFGGYPSSSVLSSMILTRFNDGKLHLYYGNGTSYFTVASPSSYPLGAWLHVAVTWKTGETSKVYVNGQYIMETVWAPTITFGSLFGIGGNTSGNANFNGLIDHFRISNRKRTPAEILAAAQILPAVRDTATTLFLPFDIIDVWVDTSASQPVTRSYSGVAWQQAATVGAPAGTNVGSTAAETVEVNAATSIALLTEIAADDKLVPIEKHAVRKEWDIAYSEKAGIDTQATTFGITTEKTTYDNAFQALGTYLNNGTAYTIGATPPSWITDANLSVTTTIVGATFRTNWKTLYDARTALLNAIAAKAKTLADNAQTQANTATTNAATAQTAANTANAALADIAADDKLVPVEKHAVRKEWDIAYSEKTGIDSQATTFGITTEKTTYDNAFQALGTYLNNGTAYTIGATPPSWITDANLSVTTTIVGATFRTNWKTLYDARTALLNAIAAKAKTLADNAQTQANTATTNAATAQTAANTANTVLADIAADDKLVPIEKHAVRKEWDIAYSEKTGIDSQATTFGITTEKTTYDNAFQALGTYLNNGTAYTIGATPPSWITDANLSVTTTIVGATFRTNWKTLYDARTALLNAIAAKAATLAAWSGVSDINVATGQIITNAVSNSALATVSSASFPIEAVTTIISLTVDFGSVAPEAVIVNFQATPSNFSSTDSRFDLRFFRGSTELEVRTLAQTLPETGTDIVRLLLCMFVDMSPSSGSVTYYLKCTSYASTQYLSNIKMMVVGLKR